MPVTTVSHWTSDLDIPVPARKDRTPMANVMIIMGPDMNVVSREAKCSDAIRLETRIKERGEMEKWRKFKRAGVI